jgi:hypothetical protein
MPIRKDYLLRIIDEFFKFLARILQLKSEKQYQQAFVLIDEASQALLHKDLNELTEKDGEIERIIEEKLLNLDQMEVLAGLIKVKADINVEISNNFTAINLYQKALLLLNEVQLTSRNYSITREQNIMELNNALSALND